MTKRGAGVAFIAISAFLISTKYLSVAIFGSALGIGNGRIIADMVSDVGYTLNIFSLFTLITGIAYIIWGELEEKRNPN
ncbi:hypothetical protein [Alkalihalobacterium chitinilyticum]|uniref:Uncharacterized protein n=1 Tax=Alkalihalobacterium chitinilyticum TaxID=2980103 RepID=A0ABT5VG35_9BACI|nr:hypothetical protein [Alkalihalobacterium chitinilyticum]MDE5414287.1 hypothetical protein [Alkalihalobacterium chitinilyticum]